MMNGRKVPLSDIKIGGIGQGGFGKVYQGQFHGTTVAVKKMPLVGIKQQLAEREIRGLK